MTELAEHQKKRDNAAYAFAKHYLLSRGATAEMIERHLAPDSEGQRASTLADLYYGLLNSAQSAQGKPQFIGGSIGHLRRLGEVLYDFDPSEVAARYLHEPGGWAELFQAIKTHLQPKGKVN